MDLQSLAGLGVLAANAIFVILAVAVYLRMNGHEERRLRYLSHALHEHREAGLQLLAVTRELRRLLEQDGARQPPAPARETAADSLPDFDFERLSPPAAPPADYMEWRRQHQVELARLLRQRRQLLQVVEASRLQSIRRGPAAVAPAQSGGERAPASVEG